MKTTTYKNIKISYTETGKGTAVVMLHGFLENQTMWQDFVPELSKKNRVITIDLLGHGQTECLGYVHSMEDQADMVHAVLHELKIRKAVLIGHSMGGYVALAFAELYADTVKGIVLLNSTSRADSDERKINRDRAIIAVKQNYTTFVRMSIANLFSEDNRVRLADAIEKVKLEDLTKICPNYFYIKYEDNGKTGYNFLWCSFDVHNNITLVDPMDLTKVLTSLAYKVKDNSTFAGVARGLNLPSSVIEEAELMDRALCDGVFKKGN